MTALEQEHAALAEALRRLRDEVSSDEHDGNEEKRKFCDICKAVHDAQQLLAAYDARRGKG